MKNGTVLISFTSASQFHVHPTKSGQWNIGLSVHGALMVQARPENKLRLVNRSETLVTKIYSGANGEAITFGRYTLVLPPLQSHAYQPYT